MLNNLPFDFLFPVNRSVVTLGSCHSFLESEPHVQVDFRDLPEDTPWGQASLTALQSLWMVTTCPLSGLQTWCYEKSPRGGGTFPHPPWCSQPADLSSPQGEPFSWVVHRSAKCPKKELRVCDSSPCLSCSPGSALPPYPGDTSQALQ